jgi:hypothetical protein
MSLLAAVVGGVFETVAWGRFRSHGAAVLIDGLWEEGPLKVTDDRVVWNKTMVFSPDDGVVERVADDGEAWKVDPNLVVLHYRRADEVVQLAVHPEELERIGRVLPLP